MSKYKAYNRTLGVMRLKKQVLYLITGILMCVLGINKIVAMSEYLFFPGIMKMVEEEETKTTFAQTEDGLTYEMILLAQENDENNEEVIEEIENDVNVVNIAMEKLNNYNYLRSKFYTVDSTTTIGEDQLNIEDLMKYSTKINTETEGPKVLIYHTHAQEAFVDSEKGDESTSIVGMGEYLGRLLNEKGIETIHHDGVYDLIDGKLDRSKAYQLAENSIQEILNHNPTIEVVIDLHRDGVPDDTRLVTEIDGKPTAKIMLFNGLSRTKSNGDISYLYNPYIDQNLSFSFQTQLAMESMYPGLARKIYLKGYRYGLHLMPKSLLVEAGAQNNTVEEMKNAMELLANVLEEVLL